MYNPFSLENKTVLVTGASSGIGRATAIECSKIGAKVIATGRNEERLEETFGQLQGDGHLWFAADLNDDTRFQGLTEAIPEIDGIALCAGIVKMLPFQFIEMDDLQPLMQTNFYAPVMLTQNLVKSKKLKKGSSIVFVSSIVGTKTAQVGNSMYSASKGALTAMARHMALDLAKKKIRVNCVLPGTVNTPMIRTDNATEEILSEQERLIPLKRFGRPEDVAHAIIYLLSGASEWVTGTELIVDGGFTLQ